MGDLQVLCLGEVLFDCLADQVGMDVDAVKSWTPYLGGAPANVASGLVKLGTSAAFMGCVGQDALGDAAIAELETAGVLTAGMQRHPTPTRQVYVTRDQAGDRQFAGFGGLATDAFADTHLQADRLPDAVFGSTQFLILGTLELAYPDTRQAMNRAVELAKQAGAKILVDVNWRPIFWSEPEIAPAMIRDFLRQVDVLKLSREEAEWLFHTSDPQTVMQDQGGDCLGVLITDGEHGCAYRLGAWQGEVAAFDVDVVDTTGAGDAFVAGFVHQFLVHQVSRETEVLMTAEQAHNLVVYASAVGALTTTKPGAIAAQPTIKEVESFLAARGKQI